MVRVVWKRHFENSGRKSAFCCRALSALIWCARGGDSQSSPCAKMTRTPGPICWFTFVFVRIGVIAGRFKFPSLSNGRHNKTRVGAGVQNKHCLRLSRAVVYWRFDQIKNLFGAIALMATINLVRGEILRWENLWFLFNVFCIFHFFLMKT